MPTFSYKARSSSGDEVRGTLVAETVVAAARLLDERSLLPVEVEEVRADARSFLTGGRRRIGVSKVGVIYEQLADLLKAGVPVLKALEVLARQATSPVLARVLREVHDDVAGGDALADAMAKHPQAFPELHVSMVRAGEKGGFVEEVLTRLSEFVARADELRNKLIGSMIYPAMLLCGLIAAVTFLMSFVVPKIRGLLESQPNLPWATKVVFAVNDAFGEHLTVTLVVLAILAIGVLGFLQSGLGQRVLARLQLKLPGFGRIYTMVALCRFCRVFGTLLASGIPILQALKISKDSTGNPILAESIDAAAENVRAGDSLAAPLAASRMFPPAIISMVAVAEESNTLEKVLVEIADTQERRTARQIDLAVRMVEPIMLLLMAVLVGFIAIALLVPILQMSTQGIK